MNSFSRILTLKLLEEKIKFFNGKMVSLSILGGFSFNYIYEEFDFNSSDFEYNLGSEDEENYNCSISKSNIKNVYGISSFFDDNELEQIIIEMNDHSKLILTCET